MLLSGKAVTESFQQLRHMKMGVREIRVQIERNPEGIPRRLEIVALRERAAQLRPGFEKLVILLDGHEIPLDRSAEIPLAIKRIRQMEVVIRFLRTGDERQPKGFHRRGKMPFFREAATFAKPMVRRLSQRLFPFRREGNGGDRFCWKFVRHCWRFFKRENPLPGCRFDPALGIAIEDVRSLCEQLQLRKRPVNPRHDLA